MTSLDIEIFFYIGPKIRLDTALTLGLVQFLGNFYENNWNLMHLKLLIRCPYFVGRIDQV